ncbi:MAG: hypothetical protein KDJ29_16530, partial [Hyphomicrobiales bacterium]|nr:hypothetical protein [Hyphomicrobiales bacterium]
LVPAPVRIDSSNPATVGVVYYGSTSPSMAEALELLEQDGIHVNAMRLRGFPFADDLVAFVHEHETVYVVEQNRDGQLRTLMLVEHEFDPAKVRSIVHYDGSPITARFIRKAITDAVSGAADSATREKVANGVLQ